MGEWDNLLQKYLMKEPLYLETQYVENIHTAFQLCPQPKQTE